jgi:hypothetical protein
MHTILQFHQANVSISTHSEWASKRQHEFRNKTLRQARQGARQMHRDCHDVLHLQSLRAFYLYHHEEDPTTQHLSVKAFCHAKINLLKSLGQEKGSAILKTTEFKFYLKPHEGKSLQNHMK